MGPVQQSAYFTTNFATFQDLEQVNKTKANRRPRHLVDVELRLAPGHFSVAGAELADEVVAAGTKGKWPQLAAGC